MFEAVLAQAEVVRSLGADPVLFGLRDDRFDETRMAQFEHHLAGISGPAAIGFAPGLAARLTDANIDLLHLHGIWHFPSLAAKRWAAATGHPLVVSPHGMLADWIVGRNRWKKALWERLIERPLWERANAFHALTRNEAEEIRRRTGHSDVRIIPNPAPPVDMAERGFAPPHLLYLGRIHPKKNLPALVEAWGQAQVRRQGAKLTIAGWGEQSDVDALISAIAASPARSSIEFVGPVYGEAKQRLIREARYLVLPSFSEGLPMAVLEAWSAGTPTLMSEYCGLPIGLERGAAVDCGTAPTSIAAALGHACEIEAIEWTAQSHAARRLAAEEFGHKTVAKAWHTLYEALLCEIPARA